MKKTNLRKKVFAAVATMISLAVLAGCVSSNSNSQAAASQSGETLAPQAAGTILLSVNPEIEIAYDNDGKVLKIDGKNDDGKKVIGEYTGYEGKECHTVVSELVEEIYQDGYFEETIDGHAKNIVIKLEEGSRYPDDDFLEEVAESVRSTVELHKLSSSAMTVEEKDYTSNGYIGLEKAKELVLKQLGLEEAQFTERDYELDDGVYELEFTANGVEYEFEVDAVTGKIMKADYEHNDDWDAYDDDDKVQATPKATPKPTVKPTIRPNDDDDDRYDDDWYEDDDNDDRYDDDWYEDDDNDDRYDDDRYDDDRYEDDNDDDD